MNIIDPQMMVSLQNARDLGLRPVWLVHFIAKDRETGDARPIGFWSGDGDIELDVEDLNGGVRRNTYLGGCNVVVDRIKYGLGLKDEPVNVNVSQIADASQMLMRGYDVRLAQCDIHVGTLRGSVFTSAPEIVWAGIVDDGSIATPSTGSDGSISFSVRSELMSQLTTSNPAKSSDEHQKRRLGGDEFSKYSGVIKTRKVNWFTQG